MSQLHAIGSSAVLRFVRNQMYFYRQHNPVPLTVPTAIASPGDSAYVQFCGAPPWAILWSAAPRRRNLSRLTTLA
eukprot:6173667-Pleurochrysis_carterae.AAC.2